LSIRLKAAFALKRFQLSSETSVTIALLKKNYPFCGHNNQEVEAGLAKRYHCCSVFVNFVNEIHHFFLVEIVVYMLAFGLGVGLVPWLLLGELCPAQVHV
jgi:hypothetical protein